MALVVVLQFQLRFPEFRDHLTLGYEILKWETDTPTPTVFHPLDSATIQEKVRLLHAHYSS